MLPPIILVVAGCTDIDTAASDDDVPSDSDSMPLLSSSAALLLPTLGSSASNAILITTSPPSPKLSSFKPLLVLVTSDAVVIVRSCILTMGAERAGGPGSALAPSNVAGVMCSGTTSTTARGRQQSQS